MDEEEARLAAEARRQRILDSANSRMDRVSGLAGSEGNEAEENAGQKKASKLAAMRRRRFQTKKAEAASAESAASQSQATKDVTTPPVVEAKEVIPEPAAVKTEEKKPDTETTTNTAAESSSETGTGDDAPKKKYMGVAKMRRKMIKEKQQQKQETEEDEAVARAIPTKFSKISPPKPTFPIIMHLLTVLFLFLAGFEVGLQQNIIEYRSDVTIHQTVAPQQELRLLNQGVSLSYFSPTPTIVKNDVAAEEPPTPYVSKEDEDEFTSAEKEDTPQGENIDPLFGIDLDELTAGPGLFMMMGRLAVSVHRVILSLVYYFPIRMWNNILALIASPPVLCLTALAIRQGSHVLGGKLPEAAADDSKMSSQPQDIMATIKNVVTNFVLKAFPTATKLYEAWTHLRSDMYVTLCGLFVGLVWHHYLPMLQGEATNDEL
uniref:Uncharacterized protein n=1 Tax=Amphora coffeiformis TaxID=265554 RepID=A0A7S3P9W3_9STRA|eukprot:scaffold638_cov168-Amphora_coffeaeformis.AAC.38